MAALEHRWNLDGRTCAEAATTGNASGSAARSDRTSAGTAAATTNDDRCGESSMNSVNPAQDARVNLVDLRVGNKPKTSAGDTHEWERLVIQDATVHRGGG